jgi:PAS domain-containing protein
MDLNPTDHFDLNNRYDLNTVNESKVLSPRALKILFNTINLGLWRWNLSTDEIFFDKNCVLIAGYGGMGQSSPGIKKNVVYSGDRDKIMKNVKSYLEGKTPWYEAEFRMVKRDGALIWVREKGAITEWDNSGTPAFMTGMLQEITPVKPAEKKFLREKLIKENERLRINMDTLIKKSEDARRMGAALFNAPPHIDLIFNRSLDIINCSLSAVEYFGFSSKETFLAQFMQFIRTTAVVSVRMDTFAYFQERLIYTARYGYCTFEIEILLHGKTIPLRTICKRLAFGGSFIIGVYLIDLSAVKNAKTLLVRQERQLKAVYTVIFLLLSSHSEDFAMVIHESLKHLGQSVKADRAYIWKNTLNEGRLQCVKFSEWVVPRFWGCENLNLNSFFYDDFLPNWQEKVSNRLSINKLTRNMESPLRLYEPSGALSLLIVPIILKEKFWGFIGLENCTDERLFTRQEETLLKTGGALMAAAIDRHEPD